MCVDFFAFLVILFKHTATYEWYLILVYYIGYSQHKTIPGTFPRYAYNFRRKRIHVISGRMYKFNITKFLFLFN
jgi:hypothetical protein